MPISWMGRTYQIRQINGQCIIELVDPTSVVRLGCEIFVKQIPRAFGPDEMVPIFSMAGTIITIRLMMEYDGYNRGMAFVSYSDRADAARAMHMLHGLQISLHNKLEVRSSRNYRSFRICNMDSNMSVEMVCNQIAQVTRIDSFDTAFCYYPTYDATVSFRHHDESVRAYNRLSSYRNLFGEFCCISLHYTSNMSSYRGKK